MSLIRVKLMLVVIAAFTLAACTMVKGIFEGDKVDYKSAGKIQPLEIPPDLARPGSSDSYAVPDLNPSSAATYSAYSKERATASDPAKATILPTPENVRIERFGNQRWLVARSDPIAVWNVVREFWQETGFAIDMESPEAGVMETDWVETYAKLPDDSTVRTFLAKILRNTRVGVNSPVAAGERIKFRTRLERGAEPGTTEIYISHRGMEEILVDPFGPDRPPEASSWKSRPSDPDLEAEMLSRLMARLGVKQDVAKAEVAAAVKTPVPLRATLLKGQDGAGTLAVNDQFDRAWRRVGLALDRVGFTVEDRDRSKGLYFVRYADPDADSKSQSKGFFSKLNPFSKSESKSTTGASREGDQYRIQVKDGDNASEVNVLGKDGSREKSVTANRILSLLYEQLK